jgi:flagellar motor switch protein FliN
MADDKVLNQDDIEKLFSQQPGPGAPAASTEKSSPPADVSQVGESADSKFQHAPQMQRSPAADPPQSEGSMAEKDIEFILNQAEKALESINSTGNEALPQGVAAFRLQEIGGAPASTETATLDLVRDVELNLKIELGRTQMYLEDVLKLRKGSVVSLDKLAGDPVDIFVNGRLIARGEVLVLNDNFCVRVAELITGANLFI